MGRALMLVLAGCYAPTFYPGAPCDLDCPGHLVCIDHICREPGYIAIDAPPPDADVDAMDGPPGDVDADGVPDGNDNCPGRANVDQHDEDADAIGDVCDPCPHLGGDAVDGDGDGVGDACDPQPGIAKQRIAFFDPFTSLKPIWVISQGFSVIAPDVFRGNGTDATGAYVRLNIPVAETRIAFAGTIVSITGMTPHSMSVSWGFNTSGTYFHYVEFYDPNGTATSLNIQRADNGTYTQLANDGVGSALPTGAFSVMVDTSVAAQRITFAPTLGNTVYTPLVGNAIGLTPSTHQAVYIRHADFRIDYYVVIETLP